VAGLLHFRQDVERSMVALEKIPEAWISLRVPSLKGVEERAHVLSFEKAEKSGHMFLLNALEQQHTGNSRANHNKRNRQFGLPYIKYGKNRYKNSKGRQVILFLL
jgi:hypothetical protein